jgi:hypothetical protein
MFDWAEIYNAIGDGLQSVVVQTVLDVIVGWLSGVLPVA